MSSVLGACPAGQDPPSRHDQHRKQRLRDACLECFVVRQKGLHERVAHHDFSGDPSEQATAQHDEDREPVEHPQDDLAAEHNQTGC